ncbi:MAG: hypothetical protein ACI4IJ_01830 [Acutalibacteraceae bacterium]
MKKNLMKAVCIALSAAAIFAALCACGTDDNSRGSLAIPVSDSTMQGQIKTDTSDSNSEYYAALVDGNFNYTIEVFKKNYSFYSQEGIDVIAYKGEGSDNYTSINIFPSNKSMEDAAAQEIENAKLLGFTKVDYADSDNSIPLKHVKISASEPKGEGVIPNSAEELYILENGSQSLIVAVGYTAETKDAAYPYLMAMVRTIKLK